MNIFNIVLSKFARDGFFQTVRAIYRYPFTSNHRQAYRKLLTHQAISARFNEIYENNIWGSRESVSGEGSEIAYTESLRKWLVQLIPEYQIQKIVDAPCGDFNWMRLVLPEIDVEYYGFDIVQSVITKNKVLYGDSNVNFETLNICEDKLPSCDLLIVRDCLFHLSYEDINKFLNNIKDVKYKYLLTTTHIVPQHFVNKNIPTGGFRLINLFKAPFFFSNDSIIERVNDFPKGHSSPREMVLIAKNDVPVNIAIA